MRLSTESERLQALRDYDLLDTGPEITFDDLTRLAAQTCQAPIALISFLDDKRQWFKAAVGLAAEETDRDVSFCTHAIQQSGIFLVPDTNLDQRFAANPLVVGPPYIRFYAGASLETADGFRHGTLCVIDDKPRPEGLQKGEREALLGLSRAVVAQLELRRNFCALRRSEERYRALINASATIEFRTGPDGAVLESQGWSEFCGQDRESYAGQGWVDALHPDDQDPAVLAWQRILASAEPGMMEFRVHALDGTYRWVLVRSVPLKNANGSLLEWVGTVADIHEQKLAGESLKLSEERLQLVAKATSDAIWDWDLVLDHLAWGEGIESLFGYALADRGAAGSWWTQHIHPDDRARVISSIQDVWAGTGSNWSEEYRFQHRAGHWVEVLDRGFVIRDDTARAIRMVGGMQDISVRKAAEKELWRTAHHDPLTGLPNRALLRERKQEAIRRAMLNGGSVALIYIDLDDFKDVNDTLGHDAGDAVLLAVAERLQMHVPSSATVARLGGDEFTVLLLDPVTPQEVEITAERLLASLAEPFTYGGQDLTCRASAGIALFPDSDASPDALLKNADMALYAAKKAGRNRCVLFRSDLRQTVQRRISVLRCVRELLTRDAIVPFYQPKVMIKTGVVTGFEALLRWRDPRGGLKAPGDIREAFDDPVLSVEIGHHMLDRVLQDMQVWRDAGVAFGHVALNVAAQEFEQTDLAGNILSSLRKMNLPASLLEIEVTESVFLGDGSEGVGRALRSLHSSGVPISLDDFGTGYASLTHLKQFPVSWLKIDQSFVRDIDTDKGDAAIVRAVIRLAHSLGIQVVAEGIETPSQLAFLKRERCDVAQGYLIAKPMAGSRVPHFLEHWKGFAGGGPVSRLAAAVGGRRVVTLSGANN